ncbi:MAG: tetratricopeptide repeat protein [Candidatus Pacebacteria bacterium]|nr:tetratricopeptide repeat protein [Candidatus Paceibacterota bacterium]MBP9715797.1 tetratricopeptide repeat protein [Candidatus Paceibacterota bacterium]
MGSKKVSIINKLSFLSLLVTALLSVFFFIPYFSFNIEASKGFLISIGVTISFFFWLVARLADGKFLIPKDKIIMSAFAIPVVFLVASLFSSSLYSSFFASGFEIGTFGSILIFVLIFFLASIYFQTESTLKYFFKYLFVSSGILALIQLVYVVMGSFSISTNFFAGITSGNLVGSWNDFVLFFGAIIILAIFALGFLDLVKKHRIFLYFLISLGLIFLMIINIPFVWFLLGIFSTIVFVYVISIQSSKTKQATIERKLPVPALVVMIVSVLFLVGGNLFGGLISNYVNIYNPDVRPSITSTTTVAWHALQHNPFFGTGPNTFNLDWSFWKPQIIKDTAYWNLDFNQGVGFIPTLLATTGVIGLLSFLVFIFLFLFKGIKTLRLSFKNVASNYFIVSSFILALYGWIILFIYTPGILLCVITFMASGVFIGSLVQQKYVPVCSLSFLHNPRNNFLSILSIVILMIVVISGVYMYTQKFISVVYFSKGLNMKDSSPESLSRSELMLLNAIALDKNDLYYRTISQVYVAELNLVLSDKNLSDDVVKSKVQSIVSSIQQSAKTAISVSPKNYQNWVNLGNVYSSMFNLGIDKAYENAVEAYDKALTFNPSNPSILLARAQLELLKKDNTAAKKYIEDALNMKKDYLDAIFAMVQIQVLEGDLSGAIKQAEYAASLYPGDSSVFFKLGILRYNNGEFSNSVNAFETAVILNPSNFDARYFLGMSYSKVGKNAEAKAQFEILNKYIPDNTDIKRELEKINSYSFVSPKENIKLPSAKKQ